ncbi:hypothetical protein [Christiangramia crocea]|uniref:Uncharacterized protein n=1 Tax=Christiangramia crocea TaxID=2904124 RepID=A0A9X2A7P6_9FLAO|nr:hypothetical protein [Gramella crocea]MCG9972106.1 hypothetical protein [Gramella crocea]
MNFWDYFFESKLYIGYAAEFIAAISGSIYLLKYPHTPKSYRLFVYFLWLVVWVEILGLYPLIAYVTDYKVFGFTEGSSFERNWWLYNIFKIVQYYFYYSFFRMQLQSKRKRRIIKHVTAFYAVSAIISIFVLEGFFKSISAYIYIVGAFGLLICTGIYLMELLNSSRILDSFGELPFYMAAGLMIWTLTVMPLFIYSTYVNSENPAFVSVYYGTLRLANLILYLLFALAFYIDYRSLKLKGMIDKK